MTEPLVRARGLNHIGILTGDLEPVHRLLGDMLGLEVSGPEQDLDLGIEVLWVIVGGVRLEFIRPTDPDSRAARAIAAGQVGVHHIAITVDDAAEALATLRAAGVATRDEKPRAGVHGSRIGFIDPSAVGGTLLELVQEQAHRAPGQ